ncbi:MAG: PKD domain-containing protein, partial [Schleiferiaceae bacterium]|nr:PKD domain-containing protein [Schleiferiaceae bacterium]
TNSTGSDSLISIPVEVTIQGTPHLAYNQDTLDFDTVASSVSYVDSIQVINPGCEPLNFNSITTSSAAFSPQSNSLSVAAYDTVWAQVSFQGSSVGLYQDSLSLNSPGLDTTLPLQAYVLGKPVIAFDSVSFNRSVNGCLDSIPFSLMLYNQGQLGLQWTAGGVTQFSDDFETGSLNSNFWDINASNGLVGNHCYVQSGSNSLTMRTGPREVVTNTFDVAQGDSVSFYAASGNQGTGCESPDGISEALHLEYKTPSGSWTNLVTVVSTNGLTKYAAQIPVSSSSMRFRFIQNNFSASSFDHYFIDDFQISGDATSPLTPASGNLSGSDSIQLSGYLDIDNLPSGAHSKSIRFTSNDPLYPDTSITVNIQINGFPKASLLSSNCLAYDTLQQGANGVDTLRIANSGCDTLDITSLQSNSGDLSWPGSSFQIAPEDTLNLPVTLSSSSLGAFSDTILVSNNDTALQVCVSAYLVGAPLASVPQDTIRYTLNKCHVVGSTSFQLDNQGQASLDYQLRIGSYQTPFSQKSYSVSGGQTAHTFNGLPSSADSIIITVVLNGDYDNWTERTSLRVDNNYQGYLPDNNLSFQPDTLVYVVPSYLHSSLLSDGSLNIDLNNSNNVSGASGSFHSVQVRVVENVNWVSFTGATSGSISAGSSASPSLLFNAALLSVGSYNTYASVSSNTPGNGYLSVPILLEVVSEPEIAVSDTCIYFSLTEVGDTTFDSLTVYNQGCQPLNLSNMFTGVSSFQVTPSTGTVPVGDSLQVQLSFIPNNTGTFNGTAIINNSDSTRTVCLQGTAAAMPLAAFSFNNENICKGEISFQHSAQNFNTLFWDFGDGATSSQPNPLHQYQSPGTYQVILRAQNAIGVDSMTQTVTANPIATNFAVSQDTARRNDTIAFTDSTNGAVSWTWDFGDGTTSNLQNPTHSYSALGLYTVRLTATDNRNCTETKSRDILVTDQNSLNDWVLRNQVNLYPNPARTVTTLSANGLEWKNFHLKIYNNLGQVVTELKPKTTNGQVKISTKSWEPGLYHLQVQKNARVMARFSLVVQ